MPKFSVVVEVGRREIEAADAGAARDVYVGRIPTDPGLGRPVSDALAHGGRLVVEPAKE